MNVTSTTSILLFAFWNKSESTSDYPLPVFWGGKTVKMLHFVDYKLLHEDPKTSPEGACTSIQGKCTDYQTDAFISGTCDEIGVLSRLDQLFEASIRGALEKEHIEVLAQDTQRPLFKIRHRNPELPVSKIFENIREQLTAQLQSPSVSVQHPPYQITKEIKEDYKLPLPSDWQM